MASENKLFHEAWVLLSPRRNHCWNAGTLKKLKQSRAYEQTAPPCLNHQPNRDERRWGVAELQVHCVFTAQPAPHDAAGWAWLGWNRRSLPPVRAPLPPPSSRSSGPRFKRNITTNNFQLFCVFVRGGTRNTPRNISPTFRYLSFSYFFLCRGVFILRVAAACLLRHFVPDFD